MRPRFAIAVLGALAASAGLARQAHALNACTSADIIASDGANCPASTAPCSIKKNYTIANGCILDFGNRAVTVSGPGGTLDVGSRSMTIKAGSFTIGSGGNVQGLGNHPAPQDRGGMIMIQTTGAVVVDKAAANGIVDVSGDKLAGTVLIQAGGPVTLKGKLMAKNSTTSGGGGSITIRAGGDFIYAAAGVLSVGGSALSAAGSIDIVASGRVDLGDRVDLVGGDGGALDVEAGADAVTRTIDADATGDAGSGGCVGIVAGTQLQILGPITEDGSGSSIGSGGGCGGFGCFESRFGDLNVSANVLAEGNVPDGGGGDLAFISRSSIKVASGTIVSARASGDMGCGGCLLMDAFFDVTSAGMLDTSGGFGGNFTELDAGRNVTLTGPVDASGRAIAGFGGGLVVVAGQQGHGNLSIQNMVDVRGGGCSVSFGCGAGGLTDLSACDVTLTAAGRLLAGGPQGGENDLTAREQLTILGNVDATTTGGTAPADGVNRFVYPSRKPPSISGSVTPSPSLTAMPTCTSATQSGCLVPCPTCGNGVVEFPETCDTAGTPQSCDSCSVFCQVENCNDANVCTSDSCSPSLGCRHVAVPDGTSCSDGNVCNGNEQCANGTCLTGVPLNCSDNNPCTLDPCDPTAGCQPHTPAGAGTTCSDNNACTIGDSCDGSGTCQPGGPRVCNDGRECTTDTCDPVRGCVFTNRTGSCTDDGNTCTADVCSGGNCTHPTQPDGTACDDGAFCTVNEACHGGSCSGGVPRSCDDGNACTTDSCDETAKACVNSPLGSCCGNSVTEPGEECDDGNTSNTDACLTTCVAARCGDGFVQTGVEECDLGAQNSNAPNAACRTDCHPQRCGDGIVDDQHGEQCDDGNTTAGDGCSPQCAAELPDTAQRIPGKGNPATDCALEWAMDRPAVDSKGVPSIKQKCKDGTSCDTGTTAGECTFSVWICANNTDPHLPTCRPGAGSSGIGTVVSAEVSKPSTAEAGVRPEDAANRQELLRATLATQASPPDFCGPRMQIRVPLKAPGRKGVKTLRIRGTTDRTVVDSDTLKLFCLP